MRGLSRTFVVALVVTGLALAGMQSAYAAFADVPSGYWGTPAIKAVAIDHDWMRDYGTTYFRPTSLEMRKLLARTLVRVLQPADPAKATPSPSPSLDPSTSPSPAASTSPSPTPAPPASLTFTDVPKTDPYYPYIDLVVRLGWMDAPAGAFHPNDGFIKSTFDITLLRALGLAGDVLGLTTIHTANGVKFAFDVRHAAMAIADEMRFHTNHGDERIEMQPWTIVSRAETAWSIVQLVQSRDPWRLWTAHKMANIVLPAMEWGRSRAVQFALNYAGYPYYYGGEWYRPTPAGYCCGAQPVGGFDCSGFSWWVLQAASSGFPVTVVRPYNGWAIPQRTSYDMARATTSRIGFANMKPMDLMFFQSDLSRTDWPAIDHVGLYLGNGWMIHSSGGRDGVTISWAGDGWWHDHFRWGRRLFA